MEIQGLLCVCLSLPIFNWEGSRKNRDIWWNPYNNETLGAFSNGVPYFPRTLNGYMIRRNQNGGKNCIQACLNLNRGFTFAGTNDNQCCMLLPDTFWTQDALVDSCSGCDTAIAANGTRSTPVPAYGLPDANNNLCSFGCRLANNTNFSTTEACGGPGNNNANTQRLSVYEYVVSGFLYTTCVLKLELLFLFFLGVSGSARTDETRTNSNGECDGIGREMDERNGIAGGIKGCGKRIYKVFRKSRDTVG